MRSKFNLVFTIMYFIYGTNSSEAMFNELNKTSTVGEKALRISSDVFRCFEPLDSIVFFFSCLRL